MGVSGGVCIVDDGCVTIVTGKRCRDSSAELRVRFSRLEALSVELCWGSVAGRAGSLNPGTESLFRPETAAA